MVGDRRLGGLRARAVGTAGELPGPRTASARCRLRGQDLGLAADWQARVVGAAGTYADSFARNLGERSRLNLPRGPNAPVEAGGRFVTPFRE